MERCRRDQGQKPRCSWSWFRMVRGLRALQALPRLSKIKSPVKTFQLMKLKWKPSVRAAHECWNCERTYWMGDLVPLMDFGKGSLYLTDGEDPDGLVFATSTLDNLVADAKNPAGK